MDRVVVSSVSVALVAGAQIALALPASAGPHDELVARHATAHGVPETLVRRVIQIESRGNPRLVSKGNYGLMQIRLGTARGLGYSGDANGLLDPDVNMTYAVRYLAGAYLAAGCNADRAVSYYQRGYYGARRMNCVTGPALIPVVQVETKSADVLKPRVVRIETIGPQGAGPSRPMAPFEPARVSPPPATDGLAPPGARMLQLAAIPMPPTRPEPDAAPRKKNAKASRSRAKADPEIAAGKTGGDPNAVVSFLKKIVATDKPSKKTQAAAEVQPPGPQPPQ
jgi:hypothetical protein